jgi:hypothetical protein
MPMKKLLFCLTFLCLDTKKSNKSKIKAQPMLPPALFKSWNVSESSIPKNWDKRKRLSRHFYDLNIHSLPWSAGCAVPPAFLKCLLFKIWPLKFFVRIQARFYSNGQGKHWKKHSAIAEAAPNAVEKPKRRIQEKFQQPWTFCYFLVQAKK